RQPGRDRLQVAEFAQDHEVSPTGNWARWRRRLARVPMHRDCMPSSRDRAPCREALCCRLPGETVLVALVLSLSPLRRRAVDFGTLISRQTLRKTGPVR